MYRFMQIAGLVVAIGATIAWLTTEISILIPVISLGALTFFIGILIQIRERRARKQRQ